MSRPRRNPPLRPRTRIGSNPSSRKIWFPNGTYDEWSSTRAATHRLRLSRGTFVPSWSACLRAKSWCAVRRQCCQPGDGVRWQSRLPDEGPIPRGNRGLRCRAESPLIARQHGRLMPKLDLPVRRTRSRRIQPNQIRLITWPWETVVRAAGRGRGHAPPERIGTGDLHRSIDFDAERVYDASSVPTPGQLLRAAGHCTPVTPAVPDGSPIDDSDCGSSAMRWRLRCTPDSDVHMWPRSVTQDRVRTSMAMLQRPAESK
jgi:hypothetical protein